MNTEQILQIIADNFLCVRRLPFNVVSYWTYKEGDENKKYVDAKGTPIKSTKTVVTREDGKKLLRDERVVEKGGWWYVKPVGNTDSTVTFNRKIDKFFAPTLEESIQLYINSKTA